jgi:hypothetical protein
VRPALAALLALTAAALAARQPPPGEDPRTVVLLRQDCRTSLGRREVTLFGNGTVRVRQGSADAPQMLLGEYSPEEVAAFQRRLAELDFSETDPRESAVEGDWVERCTLELPGARGATLRFEFGRFGSHSLALAAALRVVEDVASRAAIESARRGLPPGYEPRTGEILVRQDGIRFLVVGRTADGKGIELLGVEQPLTVYVLIAELRREFVAVEAPRGRE